MEATSWARAIRGGAWPDPQDSRAFPTSEAAQTPETQKRTHPRVGVQPGQVPCGCQAPGGPR
eukprot:5754218-Pyramimonas_sp.AAC.1